MQLRVARLCLDCEELFVGDACPVCASERYAFLSSWLPVEERRRWRATAPTQARAERTPSRLRAVREFFVNLFADDPPVKRPGAPRTRASDHVPRFDFDEKPAPPQQHPVTEQHPIKSDVR